jgi:hypothetical protein
VFVIGALSRLTFALASSEIEDMEDVDEIPALILSLEDVVDRLRARWKEEFPGPA